MVPGDPTVPAEPVRAAPNRPGERALSAARLLWPEPAKAVVAHRPPAGLEGRVHIFVLVPGARRPWWLLPAHRAAAAQALERIDVGQRSAIVWKALATAQRTGVLARIPGKRRLYVTVPPGSRTIESELARGIGDEVDVCVRLGRSRQNRSIVLRLIDGRDHTCGIAKLSTSDSGDLVLQRERQNLQRIADGLPHAITAPRLLHHGSWNGRDLMIMEALTAVSSPRARTTLPLNQMLELARSWTAVSSRLSQTPFVQDQRRRADALPEDATADSLRAAVDQLDQRWGARRLTVGSWHGDWVSWNMARTPQGIQLWDWESFAEGVPLGWDPVHYLAQDQRMHRGTDENAEDGWRVQAARLLRDALGLDDEAVEATLFGYLIELNLRYVEDRDPGESIRSPRRGWGLPLLARM